MRQIIPIFSLACQTGAIDKPVEEGPVVEIDWGSWELHTTFVQQDAICSELGGNGENLGILFGEMDVEEPTNLSFSLGDQALSGERDDVGFELTSFREIAVNGAEPNEYGIGTTLSATVIDVHSFTGTLVYHLDFPNGYCNIESDIDAYWMYYEPPPACGG